jgi:hypothetical protein
VRRIAAAVAATSLLLVVPLGAAPADAAARVRIAAVQYDSPGTDTGSNKSLNAEWVRIKNTGSSKANLRGWTLRDTSGHVYRFTGLTLRPGRVVVLHTGKGTDSSRHRYWGRGAYVWNNTGDRATLKNRRGRVVDRCRWGDGDGRIRC